MLPPEPLRDEPTAKLILPALPAVAWPVVIKREPVLPDFAEPEERNNDPETPWLAAFAVVTETAPEFPEAL